MTKNFTCIGLFAALALSACSSTPYTSPYGSTPTASNQAPAYVQNANSTYSSASASSYNEACARKETNRQLIGGGIGGTAGAFAGKEIIGGTGGTLAGAALGGALGYGLGDISVDCSPEQSNASYQSAPSSTYQGASGSPYQQGTPTYGATPASFQRVSCPAGTSAQANGTCLLAESSSIQASSVQTATSPYEVYQAPAPAVSPYQVYQAPAAVADRQAAPQTSPYTQYVAPAAAAQNVVTANTAIAPSPYSGTDITRQLGGSNYQVQAGDTVYSLSRKLCVPLSEIQSSNGLDSSYGIKIGQGLNLPASRC